ncbi:cytochrome c oxidase assembly protein [Pseudonocardia sp. Cha107L01]|uniref:cytochrome c oxidase assembly protein n=1 Tax=Pseudonocardia sp. Cha107L01 TaxID=3457576 RepID=UPI00403ED76F
MQAAVSAAAAARVMAAGYPGPPPLTWVRVITAWQLTPATVAALLLAAAYRAAVRRLRARGGQWPATRCWSFVAGGVGALVLVNSAFIGVYAGVLFWARAVQNVTLLMIVPMFFAMGAPLTLLRELAPPSVRAPLGRALRSRLARKLTFPLVVTPIFLVPLPLVYLTPIYPASLEHGWVAALVGTGLVGAGWMYFWTRFRVDPTPRTDPYLVSLGISAAEVVLDGALGLFVWLGPLLAPRYYLALGRPWGPDVRLDQIIGAGVLWIGGDLAGLPFLAVVLRRMTGEDAEQAAQVDAELDHQELLDSRAALERAAEAAGTQPAAEPDRPRLWWEDHPELAERFRRH